MDPTNRNFISIVIPAYQEAAILRNTIAEILAHVKASAPNMELIIVDDGSPDETWRITESLAAEHPEVRGVRLSRNFGKDAAVLAGVTNALGDAVIILDADLQHPPELIPRFLELFAEGYDIVEGIKVDRAGEPYFRRLFSSLFNRFTHQTTGLWLRDSTDFKLLSRRVIQALLTVPERRFFFRGTVEWLGFRKARIEFTVPSGTRSSSQWSTVRLLRLAIYAILSFTGAPLRIAHIIGLLYFVFAAALTARALYLKLVGHALDGITTVVILILGTAALIFGLLALMSEYLIAIYEEAKARPRYFVSETTKSARGQ